MNLVPGFIPALAMTAPMMTPFIDRTHFIHAGSSSRLVWVLGCADQCVGSVPNGAAL